MPKSSDKHQLSTILKTIGWRRLGAAIVFALVGSYLIFALAVSGVSRTKNPQLALMVFPNESAALASRADQIFFNRASRPPAIV